MFFKAPHFPFDPKKAPFFYGWIIVICSILGMIVSLPGQTIGFSAFTRHIVTALGISDGFISDAYALGTILSGFLIPFAGRFYDKVGARTMAVCASLGLGLVLLLLSRLVFIAELLHYNPTKLFIVLTILCFFLRFCGQGSITLASRNITMKWFAAYRGRVSTLSGVVVSLVFSLGPLVFNSMITTSGWSQTWQSLGLCIGIGFTLFAVVFFRDNPEDCGLEIDGIRKKERLSSLKPRPSWTLGEAKKTQAFWVFTLTFSLMSLYITGFTFHISSIFASVGLNETRAFSIFIPASILSVVVNIGLGWLSDRLELSFLLMIMLAGIALSLGGALALETGVGYWALIIGNGIAGGLFGLLSQISWPRFFGTRYLGDISGKMMSFLVLASALGPPLYARSKMWMGSYNLASLICLAMALALLLWAFFTPVPEKGAASTTSV